MTQPLRPSPFIQQLRQLGALSSLGGGATGTPGLSTLGGGLSALGNIYSGIRRGGVSGYGGAALAGNQLYDKFTGTPTSPLLGAAGSALGLYNNLKTGGVGGNVGAALNAGQLYGTLGGMAGAPGAATVGATAGAAALPIGMLMAMYGLFQKESQVNPHDAYAMDMNNAAGIRQAAAEPYNQPGNPWNRGVDVQAADQTEANSMERLAQESAANPGAFYAGKLSGGPGVTAGPRPGGIYVQRSAEGGSMKSRRSALDEIYKGPTFAERRHFQDGGSAYGNYYSYDATAPAYDMYSPAQLREMGGGSQPTDPNQLNYYTPSGAGSQLNYLNPNTGQPSMSPAPNQGGGYAMNPDGTVNTSSFDPAVASMIDPNSPNFNPSMLSGILSAAGTGALPKGSSQGSLDLQNALNNLKGTNGIQGFLNALGSIAPVVGAAIKSPTNTQAPTAAPGMTQGATAPKPTTFNRTQVASPSNLPGGAPMKTSDWYTYGSRPEAQFFTNNAAPLAQATGMTPGQAKGGSQGALSTLGGDAGMPEFDSSIEHHAQGPGDGTSDDIPAQLSDGEYVMDAPSVSLLGNGSNKAGAARLDQLRENIRKHAAKPMSKGKQFMKAKSPEQYMGGKAKGKKE